MAQGVVMILVMPGGRRQIDQVLDPKFTAALDGLSLDEVRERRTQAMQEESDLSYLRRMLQGRLEILRSRGDESPASDEELVAQLVAALSDNTMSGNVIPQHGFVEPSRMGERRRYVERLISDVAISDSTDMGPDRLDDVLARLTDYERQVSEARRQLHSVIDTLTVELAARYQNAEPA